MVIENIKRNEKIGNREGQKYSYQNSVKTNRTFIGLSVEEKVKYDELVVSGGNILY